MHDLLYRRKDEVWVKPNIYGMAMGEPYNANPPEHVYNNYWRCGQRSENSTFGSVFNAVTYPEGVPCSSY